MRTSTKCSPVAVRAQNDTVTLWVIEQDGTSHVLEVPCVSDEQAALLEQVCHQAFGIRSKANSFTTGLLHKDLEMSCGL